MPPQARLTASRLPSFCAGLAILETELGTVDVLAGDEIDHACDCVGTVDRAGTFLQDLDPIDQVDGNQVHIHRRGDATQNSDAVAIEQHERPFGAEAAQLYVGIAGAAAVVDLGIDRRSGDRRNPLHELADARDARCGDVAGIEHEDRACGFGVHSPDAGSGHYHFLSGFGAGRIGARFLGSSGRRAREGG